MQKPIKIWFSDMWSGFDVQNNYFTIHLRRNFNIEFDPKPDFLIHSVYGKNFLKYNCCRICISGENIRPDFKRSDFHIGFDYIDSPTYLRWPLFLMGRFMPEYLLNKKDIDKIMAEKKRFCSFVVSNGDAKKRIDFFLKLSDYKKVDSGGRFLNNIGGPVNDKLDFLKQSKFNIAFENVSFLGYTTEKIFDAFLANSIPIYWGNPRVSEDFNARAFINVHNFESTEALIRYIQYLDENTEAYKLMLEESPFLGNEIPSKFRVEKFIAFFNHIFCTTGKRKFINCFKDRIEYLAYKTHTKISELKQWVEHRK
ncbi:glycosyltransferase family 10 [Ferruginibacter paludis]|uniref:glycosyltransferase family 10 domain-containing protein n=1 Tax=Ferruginibacter paludis TaxID=1310417 RepID=UPI0025B36AF9|nr:glycosyltransferase family 10 [Ferruginibacter paludis]MDN3655862.1 glycosyltransferase family 10 [Ferruginibacter paludis]